MNDKTGKFWRNRVHGFEAMDFKELLESLNEFYKDKFVVATQVWPLKEGDGVLWNAIVYYKVRPENQ